jgi:hypothetical protein
MSGAEFTDLQDRPLLSGRGVIQYNHSTDIQSTNPTRADV